MAQVTYVDNNVCKTFHFSSCDDLYIDIIEEVKGKVSGLNASHNSEIFLQTCKELVNYLNNHSGDCRKCYTGKNIQSHNIESNVEKLLKSVTKYGGCPRDFTPDDEERIQLTYKVEQFCSKKDSYISNIQALQQCKTESSSKDKELCKTSCSEYEKWLTDKKTHFLNEEIKKKYMNLKTSNKIEFPKNCDVTEEESFQNNIDYCANAKEKVPPTKETHNLDLRPTDELYTQQITSSEQIPDYNSHTKYTAGLNHLDYAILEEVTPYDNKIYEFRSVGKPSDAHIEYEYKIDAEPTMIQTYQDTQYSSISEASNTEIAKTESGEETVSEERILPIMLDSEAGTLNTDTYGSLEENDSVQIEESNSDETISGTPYKMYLLFILMKLGLFFISFLLKKYTSLGTLFSKKKRKKRQKVKAEIENILSGNSRIGNKNVYMPYGPSAYPLYRN